MPRAAFTQADLARALKAAHAMEPPCTVEVRPDGTIVILPGRTESAQPDRQDKPEEW